MIDRKIVVVILNVLKYVITALLSYFAGSAQILGF